MRVQKAEIQGLKLGCENRESRHEGTLQQAPSGIQRAAPAGPWRLEIRDAATHNEGALGAVPAKLIAVYTVERGKTLVNPIK